jgi:hypothetical protein
MPKVYILSTHDEYGAEEIRATLDPATVESLFGTYGTPREDELTKLREAVAANAIGHHGIESGWGGVALDIVELA